ncbi:MAG: MerC domain-containing protein [Burkholderiales bacterium]
MQDESSRAAKMPMVLRTDFPGTVDQIAVFLSGLCMVHCLMLPVLLIFLPALGALLDDLAFHLLMLIGVLPVSGYALVSGYRNYRSRTAAVLGGIGLAILALAAFAGHSLFGEILERWVTIAGSILIAVAHLTNISHCRKCAAMRREST